MSRTVAFIETPIQTTQEDVEEMRQHTARFDDILLVILPPGCKAVSASTAKYGVEESFEGYSYRIWADSAADLDKVYAAMRHTSDTPFEKFAAKEGP